LFLIIKDKSIIGWGYDTYGQLGLGESQYTRTLNPSNKLTHPSGSSIAAFGCGYYHSFAVLKDGSLYTWGHNAEGQLGRGESPCCPTPFKVGMKVKVPLDASWKFLKWLFFGRMDQGSKLFVLPVEVVFHTMKTCS
jgi:alpha-tubulin suppressor-like RCC1 family protein